jgi:hypothetical protein
MLLFHIIILKRKKNQLNLIYFNTAANIIKFINELFFCKNFLKILCTL